jgi:hypothetical protein
MPFKVSFNLHDADLQHFAEVALQTQALARRQPEDATNALTAFSSPPQQSSPAGVLDHAIMIELVSRDLHHDLEAYRDFCEFRESHSKRRSSPSADRDKWLGQKREALQARMHKRRTKELETAESSVKKLFSLFGL